MDAAAADADAGAGADGAGADAAAGAAGADGADGADGAALAADDGRKSCFFGHGGRFSLDLDHKNGQNFLSALRAGPERRKGKGASQHVPPY